MGGGLANGAASVRSVPSISKPRIHYFGAQMALRWLPANEQEGCKTDQWFRVDVMSRKVFFEFLYGIRSYGAQCKYDQV